MQNQDPITLSVSLHGLMLSIKICEENWLVVMALGFHGHFGNCNSNDNSVYSALDAKCTYLMIHVKFKYMRKCIFSPLTLHYSGLNKFCSVNLF